LWEDFARNPKTRVRFAQCLKDKNEGSRWDAELAGETAPWLLEQSRLRALLPKAAQLYGGLTRSEIEKLVRHYQAGPIDLGTFALAQKWRNAGETATASAVLTCSAALFLDAVVKSGEMRLFRHFTKALGLLKTFENKKERRSTIGYLEWCKLNILFYILRHPRDSYRTRELRAHLETLQLRATQKEIRRFCTRHGIRRDNRAGRPRSRRPPVLKADSPSDSG
jgi:hypothetical protein